MAECNNEFQVPWNKPFKGRSFNPRYQTEWWAKTDIPNNVPLRRVSLSNGYYKLQICNGNIPYKHYWKEINKAFSENIIKKKINHLI